jgi:hypothetical protein
MRKSVSRLLQVAIPACLALPFSASAVDEIGLEVLAGTSGDARFRNLFESPIDGPRLTEKLNQEELAAGRVPFSEVRRLGMLMFTTPFNKHDGFGDGAYDPTQPNRSEFTGNRPNIQNNGTFLRVNGLDAQTCLECHTITSNATVPATLGVGGVGGISQNPMPGSALIDVSDSEQNGFARLNGRMINPPFLFGSGGVELVGLEMTQDLQELREFARNNPGTPVALETKGVEFGTLVYQDGEFDTSNVHGIEEDLVVRPFGRKAEFETIRNFDVGATAFHFGMQATEFFGDDFDHDEDGVLNELTEGDLSALSIFNTTMDRPFELPLDSEGRRGRALFEAIGCVDCHIPALETNRRTLPYKISGEPERPFEDTFYEVDLTRRPMRFERNRAGGVTVRMFGDLSTHDMGDELAETSDIQTAQGQREFGTARLWGVADTAPYIHDGRALTIREAIELHNGTGSEAAPRAQAFLAMSADDQAAVLRFLGSLRTPVRPNADVVPRFRRF